MMVNIAILLGFVIGLLMLVSWIRSGTPFPRRKDRKALVHRHEWTDWSEWVEEPIFGSEKRWNRQRVCHECGRTERRDVGRHECAAGRDKPCPHRAQYAALFEDKITRLERDLGIKKDLPWTGWVRSVMKYKYHGWFGPRAKKRCPHSNLLGIFGDDINHVGFRLECRDCGQYIGGPVALADMRRNEREERNWDE